MARDKKTKSKIGSPGFTIVEVMIVLAVTGLMFLSIVSVISGKQQTAQFQTSMNTMVSQLQQIGNEVASGYFPHQGYVCTAAGGSIKIASGSGSNGACNFLGKAVHFYQDGNQFYIYSIAGKETTSINYSDANPFLIAKATGHSTQFTLANDTITDKITLGYGLSVPANGMKFTGSSGGTPSNIGSFAFMQSLNPGVEAGATGGTSQHVTLMAFPNSGSSLGNNQELEAEKLDSAFDTDTDTHYPTNGTVTVCFNSGSTNQSGVITISTANSAVAVDSKIQQGSCT